uniref:DNA polymerase delta 4, accessory subunit n=1 Tax=Salmo trutta TaxID=8032 RepID=A0A674C7P4_SALTR
MSVENTPCLSVSLITDSYKVVKRSRREEKREKRAPSPPQKDTEPRPLTAREIELQELRQFDQDWRYGPCTGISRLQRWERAAQHGLNPPQEIRDMLLSADTDPDYTHCLWSDYPL